MLDIEFLRCQERKGAKRHWNNCVREWCGSYLFIYFFLAMLCGILVPWPGVMLMPPALEAWSLNHWTAREVPCGSLMLEGVEMQGNWHLGGIVINNLEQWFSNCIILPPFLFTPCLDTLDNIWRHFWLLQLWGCSSVGSVNSI